MSPLDLAAQTRIAPLLRRVLIVDPKRHVADLLGECLVGLGAGEVMIEGDADAALAIAREVEPTLIFTEAHLDADPFGFIRSIRRSPLACREAPILVLTTLATASAIRLAKDAGAHEFLRKPFSRRELIRRLDHLAGHPRPWIEKAAYVGPDRRFFNTSTAKRRLSDRLDLIGEGVPASSVYMLR